MVLITSQGPHPLGKVLLFRQVPDGEAGLIQVYIPLTTSDLYNWTSPSEGLREEPEMFLNLSGRIFQIHDPTWADI